MRVIFRFSISITVLLVAIISPLKCYSNHISGVISDIHGEPLPFASIYIKNTTYGVSSNAFGEYFIELDPGEYTIVYSYIGYDNYEKLLILKENPIKFNVVLEENDQNFKAQIANDNSEGQIVLSGQIKDLDKLIVILKEKSIKNIKLPVSAPFHCSLMNKATQVMSTELNKLNFLQSEIKLISNVTAEEIINIDELKELLIKQIENRVRWRESVINMINNNVNHFIEIGPGKVLSGLVKRINKEVKISTINNQNDIESLEI